ncbi:MAG: cytochrome c3 family protein [marine benthic group bacterium]|nr:cytochrome c3 family protein [Gemmatimonadota bacterium]
MNLRFGRGKALVLAGVLGVVGACNDDPLVPPGGGGPDNPPEIVMTAPTGGAAVQPGDMVQITWDATDDIGVTGVDLYYSADGMAETEIATDVQGATYDWMTPDQTLYGVTVRGVARDASDQTAEDVTNDIFAVVTHSERGYVAGAACADCHSDYYDDVYLSSGHPYKLNKVENGVPPTYPNGPQVPNPPDGVTWNDVSYVIGGYGWKARFIGTEEFNQGYIITGFGGAGPSGDNQWNLLPSTWTDYHVDEQKPYDCGQCHTTGWQSLDENGGVRQDGLTGFEGTYEETGIACEACHGAGVGHVSSQAASDIISDGSDDLCGTCHNRGGANADIPASTSGFIRHHEQYNEWANSPHFGAVGCNDCHDPHLGTRYDMGGVIADCESCHADQVANNAHFAVGCVTCHMPQASKSAVADADNPNFVGDVKTHIFTLNPDAQNKDYFFSEDGLSVATAAEGVTLDFACYQCHQDPVTGTGGGGSERTLAELSALATGIHDAP